MKRYFPSKTPLVLASAIALSCAIGAWFLWDIAPSGSGTAIGMGLFAMFVILIAPNQRYITAFRLRIPQRYGNDVFHAQSSSDYGSFPRTAVFYRIMTNRSIQEALQLGDPFWYDKSRDTFMRAATFIEDRFSKARYTELVELVERLEPLLGREAEDGKALGDMLRAWHVSDVSADEAVELATRYGFEAASIMVEHNVAHEYAAEMVAS